MALLEYECWVCGVWFGMTDDSRRRFVQTGARFNCIAGCNLSFGEGEVKRLQRQLEQEKENGARMSLELERQSKRAERFKCPHCTKDYSTRQKLLSHEQLTHKAPLRLVEKAGPDALNTDVGKT